MQILCSITWCQDKISNLSIHCRAMRLRQWCLDWFCPTACRWVYFHRGQMVNILVTQGDCLMRAPVDHKWICIYTYIFINIHIMKLLYILIIDRSAHYISTQLRPRKHISHDLCRSKRQGIHCPNHLHPATWILESWKSDGSLQHMKPSTWKTPVLSLSKLPFDTDFWHIWNSEWSPCRMETLFLVRPTPFMWYLDP